MNFFKLLAKFNDFSNFGKNFGFFQIFAKINNFKKKFKIWKKLMIFHYFRKK